MPKDGLGESVRVLLELPRQSRLPDPADADHRYDPGPTIAAGRVQLLLQEAKLLAPPNERRLDRHPVHSTPLGDDAQGTPRGHGGFLPFDRKGADLAEGDRAGGGTEGRLAHVDRARFCGRLQTGGRVHHIAGDHALRHGAGHCGRLPGEDAAPRLHGDTFGLA